MGTTTEGDGRRRKEADGEERATQPKKDGRREERRENQRRRAAWKWIRGKNTSSFFSSSLPSLPPESIVSLLPKPQPPPPSLPLLRLVAERQTGDERWRWCMLGKREEEGEGRS